MSTNPSHILLESHAAILCIISRNLAIPEDRVVFALEVESLIVDQDNAFHLEASQKVLKALRISVLELHLGKPLFGMMRHMVQHVGFRRRKLVHGRIKEFPLSSILENTRMLALLCWHNPDGVEETIEIGIRQKLKHPSDTVLVRVFRQDGEDTLPAVLTLFDGLKELPQLLQPVAWYPGCLEVDLPKQPSLCWCICILGHEGDHRKSLIEVEHDKFHRIVAIHPRCGPLCTSQAEGCMGAGAFVTLSEGPLGSKHGLVRWQIARSQRDGSRFTASHSLSKVK
mmetsp:Transcript_2566/g.6140  ORF Transcript_2566/g.6140 Transcript_2566/m.6140 type:complete len:283 (-) Transcript_2566:150-998(-)